MPAKSFWSRNFDLEWLYPGVLPPDSPGEMHPSPYPRGDGPYPVLGALRERIVPVGNHQALCSSCSWIWEAGHVNLTGNSIGLAPLDLHGNNNLISSINGQSFSF